MKKKLFLLVLTVSALFFLTYSANGGFLFRKDISELIVLSTSQKEYLHYDFVTVRVNVYSSKIKKILKKNSLKGLIYKDNNLLTTIGKKEFVELKYNADNSLWEGKWPVPWNADEGEYIIKVTIPPEVKKAMDKVWEAKFFIKRKPLFDLKPGLCVVTFENPIPLKNKRIKGPDGKMGNVEKMFEWVKFAGGDTFWYLAGQTASYRKGTITNEYPWIKDNIAFLPEFAQLANKADIKFGAWVVCYLTFGNISNDVNYDYAWDYNPKKNVCFPTRSISLNDKKRLKDIIDFIKYLNDIPDIDYIGLDYIRNALGGYELVDSFVEDMEVKTPPDWDRLKKEERMIWFAKKKIARKDFVLIDQWQWWRARKVALIVKEIREQVKLKKPLWAFTLSWEKGWQHGQDPVMMSDAGVDIDAIMLYEADKEQYAALIKDWNQYLGKGHANVIGGNIVDWPLHQSTVNPSGPEEMYNRSMLGVDKLYKDGVSKGAFIHCLSRVLWGRVGPYSGHEWMLAGGAVFSRLKERWKLFSLSTEMVAPQEVVFDKNFKVKVKITNVKAKEIKDVKVTFLPQKGIEIMEQASKNLEKIGAGYEINVPFNIKVSKFYPKRDTRYMVVAKTEWMEAGQVQNNISFRYVKVIDIPEEKIKEYENSLIELKKDDNGAQEENQLEKKSEKEGQKK